MGDLSSVRRDLELLELALIKLPALAAGPQTDSAASQEALLLSRTVFERSIVLAVQAGDLGAFQRAWAQLEPFYTDAALAERLPPSSERASLSALNLLRLLTISAPAEFHCKLELLPDEILAAPEVQKVVELEAWLMEGSYNRALAAKDSLVDIPHSSYFLSKLADTVREEVAACSRHAYGSLSTAEALEVLRLDSQAQLEEMADTHGWVIKDGRVDFAAEEDEDAAAAAHDRSASLPASDLIANCLLYAKELERIV
ncbi:hypothetical protein QBZ16_003675 [Prototheca wickerhamii]|uniref:CSN8/PSMD8/EIF3K domain-containing protein n=1 Tax=Prototheca wickerhamii TaxID=3111 RepID=A0AAD9IKF6_PROWI|nr:hypothetical protein QBZ16_003675 [Prototheca wickerhamii]